jgi:hypothetical protein
MPVKTRAKGVNMFDATGPLGKALSELIMAVQPLIAALGLHEGELGAEIRQGKTCAPDFAARGLSPAETPPRAPRAGNARPTLDDLWLTFTSYLPALIAMCKLRAAGVEVPLDFGRVALDVHQSGVRDVLVVFRIRPNKNNLEGFEHLKAG